MGDCRYSTEYLREILARDFGLSDFRVNQDEAIRSALSGRDTFCLMPTGAGKSICFQLPAMARRPGGVTLVISPLIALMEDQVAALKTRGIPAEFLSSTQVEAVKAQVYEDLAAEEPRLRLLYVTPELVTSDWFMARLQRLHARQTLAFLAIDEAHCISSWGHDFRPSYRKLRVLRRRLPGVPMIALTATAADKVQKDIVQLLGMQDPLVVKASFNRPNIFYEVRFKDLMANPEDDLKSLFSSGDCGIIYCHERRTCDRIAQRLSSQGVACEAYHAGKKPAERSAILEKWVSGRTHVVAATIAFGMGIDRKDVRVVCHFNLPKTIENLYQESGRAGRDQKRSTSVLYYSQQDRGMMEFLACKEDKRSRRKSGRASKSPGDEEVVNKTKALQALSKVVSYCIEDAECRRVKLLAHFGEKASPSLCRGMCDACARPQQLEQDLACLPSAGTHFGDSRGTLRSGRGLGGGFVAAAALMDFRPASQMGPDGEWDLESEFWRAEGSGEDGDSGSDNDDDDRSRGSGGGANPEADALIADASSRAKALVAKSATKSGPGASGWAGGGGVALSLALLDEYAKAEAIYDGGGSVKGRGAGQSLLGKRGWDVTPSQPLPGTPLLGSKSTNVGQKTTLHDYGFVGPKGRSSAQGKVGAGSTGESPTRPQQPQKKKDGHAIDGELRKKAEQRLKQSLLECQQRGGGAAGADAAASSGASPLCGMTQDDIGKLAKKMEERCFKGAGPGKVRQVYLSQVTNSVRQAQQIAEGLINAPS